MKHHRVIDKYAYLKCHTLMPTKYPLICLHNSNHISCKSTPYSIKFNPKSNRCLLIEKSFDHTESRTRVPILILNIIPERYEAILTFLWYDCCMDLYDCFVIFVVAYTS